MGPDMLKQIKQFSQITLLLAAYLFIAGCANPKTPHVTFSFVGNGTTPGPAVDPYAQTQLAEASSAVNQSLQQLATIEQAAHPHIPMPPPLNANRIGMAQTASLDWNGPIQPLLQKLADVSHYQLTVLGAAPAIPILVNIHQTSVTLADILRNATLQVQNRADITVYPANHVIELKYYNV